MAERSYLGMRTGRLKRALEITDEERDKLRMIALRPKSAQAMAMRARIVLGCAQGLSNSTVAQKLHVTGGTVGKWRERFRQFRLDGLLDESRVGAPRKITDRQVEEVVTKTLESMPANSTHWSTRLMAEKTGLSQTAIVRIWHAFGLQYGTHKVEKVRGWLARHPRYHVHFTPTSGSWLSLVERLFGEVTERCVRRGSHTAVRALEKAMLDYLDQRNRKPKAFVWTADADLILGKVERLCKRLSNSGH